MFKYKYLADPDLGSLLDRVQLQADRFNWEPLWETLQQKESVDYFAGKWSDSRSSYSWIIIMRKER